MSAQSYSDDPNLSSFFDYQKNTFLRKIRNSNFVPQTKDQPLLYKKPDAICKQTGDVLPLMWKDKYAFSRNWRKQIEMTVASSGLKLKLIENKDTPAVKAFLNKRYPKRIADEICAYDLHRWSKFGHGLVLENQAGEILGTVFEVGYDTPEKTSYTLRLAISEEIKGRNLGYHIMTYSSLLAMEQGSRIKRGLIEFDNLRSLHINLNNVGWICDDFDPEISELGSFFHIALPLDPLGLTGNKINYRKIPEFIRKNKPGLDYQLLPTGNAEIVQQLYIDTSFKIIALVKKGWIDNNDYYLAIPSEALQLQEW